MNEYTIIVNKIESALTQTLSALKNLTSENFDKNFNMAYSNYNVAKRLKIDLNLEELPTELYIRLKKMDFTAKLIEKEYDNVVEKYKAEIKSVSLALKNITKEKKIAIYTRG